MPAVNLPKYYSIFILFVKYGIVLFSFANTIIDIPERMILMSYRRFINITCLIILIIGGLNTGFIAVLGVDPLYLIFGGSDSIITKIAYGAVGLSAIYTFYAYIMTPGQEKIRKTKV